MNINQAFDEYRIPHFDLHIFPTDYLPDEVVASPKQRAIKEEVVAPAPVVYSPVYHIFLEDVYYGITADNELNDSALPVTVFVAQVSNDYF